MRVSYAAFPTAADPPLTVAGKLATPMAGGPTPAVLICHGSDGVDGRGEFHAGALHEAGIATLEIDMWAARGTARGAAARPRSVPDTLPDAFAAIRFLANQPEVDAERIGILGFSWGGVVSLLTATKSWRASRGQDTPPIVAHAAMYPVCWAYEVVPGLTLAELTGAPIYDPGRRRPALRRSRRPRPQLLAHVPAASPAVIRGITARGHRPRLRPRPARPRPSSIRSPTRASAARC